MSGPVLSPVDYNAWEKGYMPPSEHQLIDRLSFRGAKVVSSVTKPESGWWLVIQGDVDRKTLISASKALHEMLEFVEDMPPVITEPPISSEEQ